MTELTRSPTHSPRPSDRANSEFLRPHEVAALTTLSVARLAKLRHEGGGPPFCRAGRSIIYRRRDIVEWIAKTQRTSTSDTGDSAADALPTP